MTAQGPLAGIRVIDLTQVLAGPTATMLLADLGADVIKVEPPGAGDLSRLARFAKGGINSTFVNCNRGKRSIQIDLSTDAGRRLGLQLLDGCDVAVQNMRPGVMDSLGMGYEHAAAVSPGIVYCSMSGYGPTGPYADRAAYDPIIQAVSGYVALQVNPEVPIPDLVRNGVVDKASGWMAALAIVSALFARSQGTGGQHIDLSMLDTAVQFLWPDGGMADTLLDEDAREGRRLSTLYRLTPLRRRPPLPGPGPARVPRRSRTSGGPAQWVARGEVRVTRAAGGAAHGGHGDGAAALVRAVSSTS